MSSQTPAPVAALQCWQRVRREYEHYAFDCLSTATGLAIQSLNHRDVREVREAIRDTQPALHAEYFVMTLGVFSAGKSTFINALVGRRLLPVRSQRCTRRLTLVRHDTDERAELCYADGRRVRYPIEEAAELSMSTDSLSTTEASADPECSGGLVERERVEVFVNQPALGSFVLLDSPGFDDVHRLDDAVTRRLMAQADCVLWLVPAGRVGKAMDRELLEQVPNNAVKLGLLTQRDKVKAPIPGQPVEPELERALNEAKNHHPEIGEWLMVDSLAALKARSSPQDGLAASGLLAIEERIAALARGTGGRGKLQARHEGFVAHAHQAAALLQERRTFLENRDKWYVQAVTELVKVAAQSLLSAAATSLLESEVIVAGARNELMNAASELVPSRVEPGFRDRLIAHIDLPKVSYRPDVATGAWGLQRNRLLAAVGGKLERPLDVEPTEHPRSCLPTALSAILGLHSESVIAQVREYLQSSGTTLPMIDSSLDTLSTEDRRLEQTSLDQLGVVLCEQGGPEGEAAQPGPAQGAPVGSAGHATTLLAVARWHGACPERELPRPVAWNQVLEGVRLEWLNSFGTYVGTQVSALRGTAQRLGDWLPQKFGRADNDYEQSVVAPIVANLWRVHWAGVLADTRWLYWQTWALVDALIDELRRDAEKGLGDWHGEPLALRQELSALREEETALQDLSGMLRDGLSLSAFLAGRNRQR